MLKTASTFSKMFQQRMMIALKEKWRCDSLAAPPRNIPVAVHQDGSYIGYHILAMRPVSETGSGDEF